MNSSKAQGATEYMIVLAIVIIIALLVIIVMKGVPSIGKSGATRSSAAFWETADIGFMAYAVDSSGITMNIRNNYKNTIRMRNIEGFSPETRTYKFNAKIFCSDANPGRTHLPNPSRSFIFWWLSHTHPGLAGSGQRVIRAFIDFNSWLPSEYS